MLEIKIHDESCRGCELCVDVCPTDVLAFDKVAHKATIQSVGDCIACLSCAFICPSGAITHSNIHHVKNFYRDLDFCRRVERFL